jgi:hypothetical protein
MGQQIPSVDRRSVLGGLAGAGSLPLLGTAGAEERTDAEAVEPDQFNVVYRLFNPEITNHFYTTSVSERRNAIQNLGYNDEGVEWVGFDRQVQGTNPIFRLYSPSAQNHFYTDTESEAARAADQLGYNREGILVYLYERERFYTTPIYRLYNPQASNHFYTTSESERDNAIRNLGYRDEGNIGDGFA